MVYSIDNQINNFYSEQSETKNRYDIWNSYQKITEEYEKIYNEMTIKDRICLHIESLFKETILTKFKKFENTCLELNAKAYGKDDFLTLSRRIEKMEKGLEKRFLQKTMTIVKENILNNASGKGFLYQIKNKKNGQVVGHFIGTIHPPGKISNNITITESMKEAINKSQSIITELGDSFFGNLMAGSTIDMKITQYAKENGKKIEGFETIFEQLKILVKFQQNIIQNHISNKLGNYVSRFFASINLGSLFEPDDETYYMVDLWKKGEELKMIQIAGITPKELLEERNKNWLQGKDKQSGLLEKLSEANEQNQICVAVGALHLFSFEGLITQLRLANYGVERIET